MDEGVIDTVQNDLSSTMGNVLSTTEDKQADNAAVNSNTSDAIPSSSSDANVIQFKNDSGLEDPISSTSDSLLDAFKRVTDSDPKTTIIDSDVDMFANDFNISDIPSEKITEDVEDIVNELENLLEEGSSSVMDKSSYSCLTINNITKEDESPKDVKSDDIEEENKDVAIEHKSIQNKEQQDPATIEKDIEMLEKEPETDKLDFIVDDHSKEAEVTNVNADLEDASYDKSSLPENICTQDQENNPEKDESEILQEDDISESIVSNNDNVTEVKELSLESPRNTINDSCNEITDSSVQPSTSCETPVNTVLEEQEEDPQILLENVSDVMSQNEIIDNVANVIPELQTPSSTQSLEKSCSLPIEQDKAEEVNCGNTLEDVAVITLSTELHDNENVIREDSIEHEIDTIPTDINAKEVEDVQMLSPNAVGDFKEDNEPVSDDIIKQESESEAAPMCIEEVDEVDLFIKENQADTEVNDLPTTTLDAEVGSTNSKNDIENNLLSSNDNDVAAADTTEKTNLEAVEFITAMNESETEMTENIELVTESNLSRDETFFANSSKEIELNYDNLNAIEMEDSSLVDLENAAAIAAIDAEQTTLLEELTNDNSNSINCNDVLPSISAADTLVSLTNDLPMDINQVTLIENASCTLLPKETDVLEPAECGIAASETTDLQLVSIGDMENQSETEGIQIEGNIIPQCLNEIIEESSIILDDNIAKVISEDIMKQSTIEPYAAEADCTTNALIDGQNNELEKCKVKDLPPIQAEEPDTLTSGHAIASSTSKLVVELSLADTTATSDCDMQSESEKETDKVPETSEKEILKTDKPLENLLSKVLTIEVDEVHSENYETSNDETLECSSRSDLEDSKPEYSSRISKSEDLKMVITKQKPEECHSILKIFNPDDPKDSIPKFKIRSGQQEMASTSEIVPKLSMHKLSSPKSSDSPNTKLLRVFSPNSQKANTKSDVLSPIKLTIKPVKPDENQQLHSSPKITIKPVTKPESSDVPVCKGSPKITIKPLIKPEELEMQKGSKLKLRSDDDADAIRTNTKLTIKPIVKPEGDLEIECPKVTIKPIIKPECENIVDAQRYSPKVTIKPIVKCEDELSNQKYSSQSSPKITIKPIQKPNEEEDKAKNYSKSTMKPIARSNDDFGHESTQISPKITIKPIVRSVDDVEIEESRNSPKITIKPIIKPDDETDFVYSPKLKSILMADEDECGETSLRSSPKLIIKPIIKSEDNVQDPTAISRQHSPKITIKPIHPKLEPETVVTSPRITIKPIAKPEESDYLDNVVHSPKITIKPIQKPVDDLTHSPRITIKPIVKHDDDVSADDKPKLSTDPDVLDYDDENRQERIVLKINKNTIPTPTSSRKREYGDDEEKSEKLGKIKLKFSKEDGHAEIVMAKRQLNMDTEITEVKRAKSDVVPRKVAEDDVEIIQIAEDVKHEAPIQSHDLPTSEGLFGTPKPNVLDAPIFDSSPDLSTSSKTLPECIMPTTSTPIVVTPMPRKRGRPRKVPLEVREEFKDENAAVVEESTRPKRSCRGPSVRATLGIKPRKPRGPGRGRGGKRGMGTGRVGRPPGRPKLSATKLKLLKETVGRSDGDGVDLKETKSKLYEVVIIEEETRMSADTNCSSRAQTPAKQIQGGMAPDVEESQSSVQSSATTESAKGARGRGAPRFEVHQEPEGSVISADQLAEYYWGGGGPYMLQEQVAQFLGIKSFKRKYPGIKRRPVEMQERDFIREQGLASEAMCDLGLTAVNSSDILDIMYSDFQYKYEEYCKHQRDRQAKDFTNKQKALSLQVSQEKNTLAQQAVQSASTWNSKFNKTRREERRACIDLQTFTVHYPRGKMKQMTKLTMGHYPLALVPGQFTDYYKQYTPLELMKLPLNTVCYDPLPSMHHQDNDDSQSDCSGTDSETSSTDSCSSTSESSDDECNACPSPVTPKNILAH